MRHVATNNQQAAASFIGHGHQEAFVRRLNIAYRDRALALRAALAAACARAEAGVAAHGGSALWVSAAQGIDTRALAARLYRQGVVVEPGDVFFAARGRRGTTCASAIRRSRWTASKPARA
jgi:GntR family transcriptional regulator/MocR family aminotransferase